MGCWKPLASIHAFQTNPKHSLQCRRMLGGRNYSCSLHLWFYDSGRLRREEAPFPPLLGKFQQALSRAKTFARPKKTPALQANPKHSTKALIIIFSLLTSLLEQEAWLVHKCCANPRHWRFVYIPKSICQCLSHLPTFPPVTPLEE